MRHEVFQAFVKEAADVQDARSGLSGTVARTLGTINPNTLIGAIALSPHNPRRHLEGLTPEQAKRLADAADKDYGDLVSDTKVRVGGGDLLDDYKRIVRSDRLSLPEKVLGLVGSTPIGVMAPLGRADHFNPFSNTVHSYSGDPAVLGHELGHAADINRFSGAGGAVYRTGRMLSSLAGSVGATSLGASSEVAKAVGGLAAQPLTLYMEGKATQNALQGDALKRELAEQYGTDDLEEGSAQARNILIPAYGSYLGGAAAGGLALRAALKGQKVNKRVALIPLAGVAAGHLASRGYNAIQKYRRSQDRVKAASLRALPGWGAV